MITNPSYSTASSSYYDVIVIGAGPAGYSSAIRCAQLGLKTACVDSWQNKKGQQTLGGFHLNSGCIASITLLESAKLYHRLHHQVSQHGIHVENISLDLPAMIARKNNIIHKLGANILSTFKELAIDSIHAKGKLLNAKQVEITPLDNSPPVIINAKNIILATGSSPVQLPYAPCDNDYIIDSLQALNINELPHKIAIIGAGVNGLEIASIWNRLGVMTILLEAQEDFLPLPDQHISREAYRIFTEQGLDLRLGARVIAAKKQDTNVVVDYQDQDGTHTLTVDKLIVASGRKPNTENLAAPEANLLLDESGYIHVDENCRTNLPGVYAIGDLNLLGPMLAHKGIEEGNFVAESCAGLKSYIHYDTLPSVMYTDPEIAWVGQTEHTLKTLGIAIKIGIFALKTTARAQATGKTEGLIKIITDADTDKLLGVHIIGHQASELIAEAVLAMEFSASGEDLARTIHAHPTVSEAFHDAALVIKQSTTH
jgi:dihydrolipoamide dehydrogenase